MQNEEAMTAFLQTSRVYNNKNRKLQMKSTIPQTELELLKQFSINKNKQIQDLLSQKTSRSDMQQENSIFKILTPKIVLNLKADNQKKKLVQNHRKYNTMATSNFNTQEKQQQTIENYALSNNNDIEDINNNNLSGNGSHLFSNNNVSITNKGDSSQSIKKSGVRRSIGFLSKNRSLTQLKIDGLNIANSSGNQSNDKIKIESSLDLMSPMAASSQKQSQPKQSLLQAYDCGKPNLWNTVNFTKLKAITILTKGLNKQKSPTQLKGGRQGSPSLQKPFKVNVPKLENYLLDLFQMRIVKIRNEQEQFRIKKMDEFDLKYNVHAKLAKITTAIEDTLKFVDKVRQYQVLKQILKDFKHFQYLFIDTVKKQVYPLILAEVERRLYNADFQRQFKPGMFKEFLECVALSDLEQIYLQCEKLAGNLEERQLDKMKQNLNNLQNKMVDIEKDFTIKNKDPNKLIESYRISSQMDNKHFSLIVNISDKIKKFEINYGNLDQLSCSQVKFYEKINRYIKNVQKTVGNDEILKKNFQLNRMSSQPSLF